MIDMFLTYRACGAECREDWLRMLANDNGLRFEAVRCLADRLGEREDFGALVHICEERAETVQLAPGWNAPGASRG